MPGMTCRPARASAIAAALLLGACAAEPPPERRPTDFPLAGLQTSASFPTPADATGACLRDQILSRRVWEFGTVLAFEEPPILEEFRLTAGRRSAGVERRTLDIIGSGNSQGTLIRAGILRDPRRKARRALIRLVRNCGGRPENF